MDELNLTPMTAAEAMKAASEAHSYSSEWESSYDGSRITLDELSTSMSGPAVEGEWLYRDRKIFYRGDGSQEWRERYRRL